MKPKSIRHKLTLTLVGLVAVVFALFLWLLNRNLRDLSGRQVEESIAVVGRNAAAAARSPLFYRDHTLLASTLEPLVLAGFDYFFVYDRATRNLAYQAVRSGMAEAVAARVRASVADGEAEADSRVETGGVRYRQFAFEVRFGRLEEPSGLVIIGISEANIRDRTAGITRLVLIYSLTALLLIILVVWTTAARLSRPIAALSKTIGAFSAGDYGARADIRSGDEIQTLGEAFNGMAQRIVEQIASIESSSRNLEKMVEARSISLQRAMSELNRKEKELLQTEKLRGLRALVSSIAHEINNPMTVIYGNLQLLEGEAGGAAASRFPVIYSAVDRINRLIDDITFFSGIREVTMGPVDVGQQVQDAVRETLPAKGIDVEYSVPDSGPVTLANLELLRRSLVNVLENAVQVLERRPPPRRMRVAVATAGNEVTIEVEDNGGGFVEIGRVFEPFYTTHPERRGLGLAFAQHIVQLHGGRIEAANTESGARLTIRLPRAV